MFLLCFELQIIIILQIKIFISTFYTDIKNTLSYILCYYRISIIVWLRKVEK